MLSEILYRLNLLKMEVMGDEEWGYSARFPGDPNWVWAYKRETAIEGCKQRRQEVIDGKLRRGKYGFYSP